MPSLGGVVGAPWALWTALIALVAILVLVVRGRWRRASARREEIRRLVEIAAAEAARAEAEAEVAVEWRYEDRTTAVVGGEGMKQCTVCYSHTTTRCSRCKAVRYCSGRCQIIHWRQGHKDECRPPDDVQHDMPESGPDLDTVHSVQSKVSEDTSDNFTTKLAETFIGRHASFDSSCSSSIFSEDQKVVVVAGEDSCSDSSISSSCSSTPIHKEKPVAVSIDTKCDGVTLVEGKRPPPHEFDTVSVTGKPRDAFNISAAVHTRIPPSVTVGTFISQASHSSKVTSKPVHKSGLISNSLGPGECNNASSTVPPGHQDVIDVISLNSSTVLGDPLMLNARNRQSLENKRPLISSESAEPVSSQSFSVARAASHKQEDGLVTCRESNKNEHLPKSKSSKIPSNFDTANYPLSGMGKFISGVVAPASMSGTAQPGKFVGKAGTALSSGSSLKVSVRKAAQQFRQSKPSRPCKMPFPYELFVKLYNEKVEMQPCGFANLGNSCYVNVVLQCLVFTRPLTAYLLQGLHKKTCQKKEWCFTCEFESLVMEVKQSGSPLSPTGILLQIHNIGSHLGHGKEEDAHEFLRYAIDAMQTACLKESCLNEAGKFVEETSLMQLIFGGYLRSKIKCMRCHVKSEHCERMMDLIVEIQGDIGNLDDALRRFTSTELLDGDNRYRCDRCESYERAKKKLTVAEAPNILTIVLKRFQSGKFGKINKAVKFPEILNLAPFVSNPSDKTPVYSLYAVVVHVDVMNAAFSGHYVCYVKNHQGRWFKADDSSVKPVALERVLSKGAYMLLYARCSPRAPSLIWDMMPNALANMKRKPFNGVLSGPAGANPLTQSISSHTWDEFDPLDPRSGRFFPASQTMTDSMSVSSSHSSLLSCSDEGSCSTESTRDSTSTDDYSGNFSPSRFSEDSDCPYYSPSPDSHPCEPNLNGHLSELRRCVSSTTNSSHLSWGEYSKMSKVNYGFSMPGESPPILLSDSTKHCRKLTEQCSGRETDWANPCEAKSSSLTRRPTRDKTA